MRVGEKEESSSMAQRTVGQKNQNMTKVKKLKARLLKLKKIQKKLFIAEVESKRAQFSKSLFYFIFCD